MSHVTLWICSLVVCLGLSSCALFEERKGPSTFYGAREQVFYAGFDEVWRAVNVVLQPYPLRISNMDQGLLETDSIRGYRVYHPAHKPEAATSTEVYRLTVRVVKGNLESRVATKVTIVKDSQTQRDFFSDPKALGSDGFEEKTLLYRVGREIQIERAIAKAQKKQNQSSDVNPE